MALTVAAFRRMALSLPEATEVGHMGHPDFRVGGKIFATLGYPDKDWAVLKLTSEQQAAFMDIAPRVFTPVKGGWGLRGATQVRLSTATLRTVGPALETAWRNVAPARLSAAEPTSNRKRKPGKRARPG
jgi:hypothetical protein